MNLDIYTEIWTVPYIRQDHWPSETCENEKFDDNSKILLHFRHSEDTTTTDIFDNSHVDKLTFSLNEARKKGSFCDITLLVGAEKHSIKAHRLVLAAVSDYFRAMLTTDLKEASQSEVELPKADAHTMEYIINFAYTGNIKLSNHNIENVTSAANFFGISTLLENCVEYIKKKIDNTNCIEILELADRISNILLKDFTMRYITENVAEIVPKNLELVNMSTPLLLEIIANAATSIHNDSTQNEERLFQIGWNVLHSRTDEEWARFLPKLLKAVHLPQASYHFLYEIARKVEDSKEAKTLIQEAKFEKQLVMNYKATLEEPEIKGNIIWRMPRFQKSGKLSVTCHGLKKGLKGDWYGAPAFINGRAWYLRANLTVTRTVGYNSQHVRFFSTYLHRLSDFPDQTVQFKCSLLCDGQQSNMKSYIVHNPFSNSIKNQSTFPERNKL